MNAISILEKRPKLIESYNCRYWRTWYFRCSHIWASSSPWSAPEVDTIKFKSKFKHTIPSALHSKTPIDSSHQRPKLFLPPPAAHDPKPLACDVCLWRRSVHQRYRKFSLRTFMGVEPESLQRNRAVDHCDLPRPRKKRGRGGYGCQCGLWRRHFLSHVRFSRRSSTRGAQQILQPRIMPLVSNALDSAIYSCCVAGSEEGCFLFPNSLCSRALAFIPHLYFLLRFLACELLWGFLAIEYATMAQHLQIKA